MPVDPTSYQPLDPGRVETLDSLERAYWCKEFSITEAELMQAVAEVGNHVSAVRDHLESAGKALPKR
ncbi:MAG: hypothetical protein JWP93_2372 [Polaromonas sp.]|nr:hypothetical protein [Polaromonas sp.]